jgi:hypothetical protein
MNDDLRRKVVVRKAIYFGVILALFTLSMFWRGVFSLPIGDPNRGVKVDPETNQPLPMRWQDEVARLPIRFKADDLELRELDLGDPEVAAAIAQVSLIGSRGPVVTYLWRLAIQYQVRGEYDKMEFYARMVSRLQPHFIEPWIFQAWNISYNVSVETDKMGDQYYYIAKGISFLSEGDRTNTRIHRRGGVQFRVGSPDIRYQLGFYNQNKFNVADKVETLRCLAALSVIPPGDRDPTKLTVDGTARGRVDPERYLQFCRANPQLVRRLKKGFRNPTTNQMEGLNLKTPEAVVEFLAINQGVPARYLPTGQEAPDDLQFPVFPKADPVANPTLDGFIKGVLDRTKPLPNDRVDMMHVARAWFEYAQDVVPPPVKPGQERGVPSAVPKKGEYDEFRYRIPQRPALIVFRQAPPRSQAYLAERLQKEGWITADTTWEPDAATDDKWFPSAAEVQLKAALNARQEWSSAYDMWARYGRLNGMDPADRDEQARIAEPTVAAGLGPLGMPLSREYSDDDLAKLGLTREMMNARNAVMYFDQNRHVTNYQFFLDSSLLETDDRVTKARELLWTAKQLRDAGEESKEIAVRVQAAALWREAVADNKFRAFYATERSQTAHEFTLEQEVELGKLLEGTPDVTRRVAAVRLAVASGGGVAANLLKAFDAQVKRIAGEQEAVERITAAYRSPELDQRVNELVKQAKDLGADPDPVVTRRGLINRPAADGGFDWMKTHMDPTRTTQTMWVSDHVRSQYLTKIGALAPPEPPPATGPGTENEPPPTPPTRQIR